MSNGEHPSAFRLPNNKERRMNLTRRLASLFLFLIAASAIFQSCGDNDSDPAILEIHLKNLDAVAGRNVTMVVRVNGDEKYSLPVEEAAPIPLEPGVNNVGIDFKMGNELKNVKREIPIQSDQREIWEIDLKTVFSPENGIPLKVGRMIMETSRFKITKVFDFEPAPDINILKVSSEGLAIIEGVTPVIVEDDNGKKVDEFQMSADFWFDDGLLKFVGVDEQQNLMYKGNSSGRFTVYRGRRENGDIIFEGVWVNSPTDSWDLVLSLDNQIISWEAQASLEADGKGIYQGHFLKGLSSNKLNKDVFEISMEADLFRVP
jgi:hypothetical protein